MLAVERKKIVIIQVGEDKLEEGWDPIGWRNSTFKGLKEQVYLGKLYVNESKMLQVMRLRPDNERSYILRCLDEETWCVEKYGMLWLFFLYFRNIPDEYQ